ncbi:MAG: cysteine--tRNA ligase [Pseudomonadota bacterium]
MLTTTSHQPPTSMFRLTNTLSGQKEEFKPIDATNVRMYACGITPYDFAHLGNAATAVAFDMLFRVLREIYGEKHVTFVRNITDIDDKIINRAKETGEDPRALSAKYSAIYEDNLRQLGCLPPTQLTLVSTHLPEIISMIDALIEKDFGYITASGDVMYRVSKFPSFGALVKRKLDEQQQGARVAIDDEKEAAEDFVLWKANAKSSTKMEQAFNPEDLGAKHFHALGRPGWHIECSAMCKAHLGDTFDIHAGGEDLKFPHHSCEIAQTEALLPAGQHMANYWLHRAFITVEGKKMSKSLGNFVTVPEVLAAHPPMAIRYWLLQTHYRKPVDYSDAALKAAAKPARRITDLLKRKNEGEIYAWLVAHPKPDEAFVANVMQSLCDDLNTSKALAALNTAVSKGEYHNVVWAATLLGFKA